MKQFKMLFIIMAVTLGIGGAFATARVKAPCELMTKYRYYNGSYVLAGTYGDDYLCIGSPLNVCTWYKPWPSSNWTPCESGSYFPFDELNKKK